MLSTLGLVAGLWLAAPPHDTTITVRGILQLQLDSAGHLSRATLFLPEPVSLEGRPIGTLVVSGDPSRWRRYDSHYVELTGAVNSSAPGGALLYPTRVREVEPEGTVGKTVSLSFSQRGLVSLAVLPRRFAWPAAGGPGGVTPIALFRIGNHGDSELQFEFESNEFVCVEVVSARGDVVWDYRWRYPAPDTRLTVRVGTVFWATVPLPREALAVPGRYTVRASLCGVPDYRTETTVEVTG
jgi:hypothetical protein